MAKSNITRQEMSESILGCGTSIDVECIAWASKAMLCRVIEELFQFRKKMQAVKRESFRRYNSTMG